MRKAHLLRPTSRIDRPTSVIFFDTETNQIPLADKRIQHTLKIGVAQHYRQTDEEVLHYQSECIFDTIDGLWSYVHRTVRKKSTCYLVSHNIIFDLTVTRGFSELAILGWQLESFYTKGVVSVFRWKQGDRRLIGVDNSNLFAGKLAKWGDIFKLPKLAIDFDTTSLPALVIYCRRDVEIMVTAWRSWLSFLDEHQLGSFKSTVGATALSAWKNRFMPGRVYIHDNEGAIMLERESYRGGRVECLYQGRKDGGKFYYLDVNNMYGYVLSKYQYPASLWDARSCDNLSILLRKLEKHSVIARVTINPTENYFPLFIDGHVCYPTGTFDTTLTTPELILCYQRGWLKAVSALAWYRSAPLFEKYVTYFHTLRSDYRQSDNDGYATICKLLINSLYGKFGQLGTKQIVIGQCELEKIYSESVKDIDTGEIYRMLALGGQVFEEHKTGESANSFPAISAHVTAYARLYLNELRMIIPNGHCFYMDTDSLIVDEIGMQSLKHLIHPTRLGALKIELESDFIEINAPKDYAMTGRKRIKGIRPNAVEDQPGVFLQEQWQKFNGALQSGDLDNYYVRPLVKHQKRLIYSGLVLPSGFVQPFDLGPVAEGSPLPVQWQPVQRQ